MSWSYGKYKAWTELDDKRRVEKKKKTIKNYRMMIG